jgi:hypothetical protein
LSDDIPIESGSTYFGEAGGERMDYDRDKVDEITLALLWLTCFKDPVGVRAWKGQDWETMERLHAKGFISDPKSKAKSVVLSEEGKKRSRELFAKHFGPKPPHGNSG